MKLFQTMLRQLITDYLSDYQVDHCQISEHYFNTPVEQEDGTINRRLDIFCSELFVCTVNIEHNTHCSLEDQSLLRQALHIQSLYEQLKAQQRGSFLDDILAVHLEMPVEELANKIRLAGQYYAVLHETDTIIMHVICAAHINKQQSALPECERRNNREQLQQGLLHFLELPITNETIDERVQDLKTLISSYFYEARRAPARYSYPGISWGSTKCG